MSKTIQVFGQLGGEYVAPLPVTLAVKAGADASIQPGFLVIVDGGNAGYVKAAPDGTDSDSIVLGVADSVSTDTVGADGTVTLCAAPSNLIKIKAKTPASLVASMKLAKYTLSVSGSDYTLDQGTTTKGIFSLLDFDNTTDGNCIASFGSQI